MYSIDRAKSSYQGSCKNSYVAFGGDRVPDASAASVARVRNLFRLPLIILGAASLAACAESNTIRQSAYTGQSWQASPTYERTASYFTHRRIASVRKHTPFARHHNPTPTRTASQGIASFYTADQETASGEKFNTHDLTAAHPTLPFGTRLRVTNVSTGKSVTVRINDRGPYVPGRVVDLSHSAASEIGMVESGIAKVKLDVVQ